MSLSCPSFIANYYPQLCVPVDNYCERTSAALDAEPVNALTNAAFLIAAWAALRLYRRHPYLRAAGLVRALIATMVLVGAGSFLFHTVGTRWAEWGDVLPILLFMMLYLWLLLTVVFAWSTWSALIADGGYIGLTVYLEAAVPASVLWGGALYIPTLAVIVSVAAALYGRSSPAASGMSLATCVFLLSFAARTLDSRICSTFPLGTHFLWHLLNATLLFLLIKVAITARSTRVGRP